jgi:acetyl-CoA carboxylase alpha subunit
MESEIANGWLELMKDNSRLNGKIDELRATFIEEKRKLTDEIIRQNAEIRKMSDEYYHQLEKLSKQMDKLLGK